MRVALLFIFCLTMHVSLAQQVKFSDQPEPFAQDVQTVLTSFGQAQLGADFNTAWASMSSDQKTQVMALTKAMIAKNMKQPPYLLPWFQALNAAVQTQQMKGTDLSNFLTVTEKTFKSSDSKGYLSYLNFSRLFLTSRQLFTSNFNKLYTSGGKFNFRFIDQPLDYRTSKTDEAAKPTTPTENKPADEPTDDGWGNTTSWDDSSWDTPVAVTEAVKALPQPQTLAAGPVLDLQDASFSMVTAQDSFVVDKATLSLGIKEGLIYGKSGHYTWNIGELNQAGVDLKSYKILVKTPRLFADEATLTYKERLSTPVKGNFRFESRKRPANAPVTQPQFQSEEADVEIKNLGKDLTYRGGFALIGSKAYGAAANGKRAIITVQQDGQVAFKAQSKGFELSDSLIYSPAVQFTGYYPTGDTLTHPSIRMTYNTQTKQLRLARQERGGYRSASFSDSYHGFAIRADAAKWSLPSKHLEFDIISGQNAVPARFESVDYYESTQYEKLTSPQGFHPVTILANCLKQKGVSAITVDELAAHYKRDGKLMRDALIPPIEQGFIDYNPDTDQVRLSSKGQHYLQVALAKKDFDNLAILSTQAGSDRDSLANASINFKDNFLTIRGVAPFKVSDSLKIFIRPADKVVRVGKNRSFVFNGEMKLDNFRFKGRDLNFNYEQFYVNLDKLDTVTFVPQQMKGKKNSKEIGQDLKYGSGKLYLGKPNNKSGKKPSAPRLVVQDGVNIYFDDTTRLAGAYNRKVYFKIPKIDQDSLTSKDIEFSGTFYSDGVLPPIQTKLITMPDNSLGFAYKVPEAGLKLYEGKGNLKVTGTLTMDNNGLKADGVLSTLTTSLEGKQFVLTPDSVVSFTGTSGRIKEGTVGKAYFPEVAFKSYEMKWLPKVDSLVITEKESSLDFYNGSSQLKGSLLVRSTGLFGEGVMKRKDSEISSENFSFNKNQFIAQRAQIQIGTGEKPALLGRAVDVTFNTAAQNALIQTPKNATLEDSSSLFFPYAAYTTTINRADWDIAKKTITMKGNVNSSTFISTNPSQEGLAFNGAEALYEIDKMTLNIKGVPYIKSADAKIIPNKGLVSIKQDAEMIPLKKARVVADTVNEFHHLSDGNIQILSAKKFEGDAIYQYIRSKGDTTKLKIDAFEFREVTNSQAVASAKPSRKNKAEKTVHSGLSYGTVARSGVSEENNFLLTPRLAYKGDITMVAANPGLTFKGAIQTRLKSKIAEPSWIPFEGSTGDSLSLSVDGLKAEDGQTPLYTGLHFGGEGLYLSFLSPKVNPQDADIFTASGRLRDDVKTNQLTIASDVRANDETLEGPKYVLNDNKKIITFEGPIQLFSPATAVQSAGYARLVPDSTKYLFNTLLVLNTSIAAAVMNIAGDKIVKTNLDEKISEEAAEPDFDRLLLKIANVAGGKTAEQFTQKSTNGANVPLASLSPKFAATAVLSNLSMRYNPENQAFYNVGKIGVSNLGTTDINGQFDGALEIRKNPGGMDDLFFYLELNPDVWYYLALVQGTTEVYSSDQDFNGQLQAKTGKDNKIRIASEEDKNNFVDRFSTMYRPRSSSQPRKPKPVVAAQPKEEKAEPTEVPQQVTGEKPKAAKKEAVSEEKVAAESDDQPVEEILEDPKSKKSKTKNKKAIVQAPVKKPVASDSTKTKKITSLSETEEAAPVKKPAEKKTGF
ncbi:hypothetical protein [Siphonobacter sp. SORGH_AS_0500]|uniref:hypothetical protein n=1 Tax=Siphonobacter sp. SORGH_AS_0500 TaxID=1864824 RepID=UPI00285A9BC9|nr:hypothetical protein [Siphonobacter sp. SORGH_AS_0500]MDR6196341.1 hypothetical protein [Siphonobacter sp. SORGH_AS_0500]